MTKKQITKKLATIGITKIEFLDGNNELEIDIELTDELEAKLNEVLPDYGVSMETGWGATILEKGYK